jgi:hypothetical protein
MTEFGRIFLAAIPRAAEELQAAAAAAAKPD